MKGGIDDLSHSIGAVYAHLLWDHGRSGPLDPCDCQPRGGNPFDVRLVDHSYESRRTKRTTLPSS